MSINVIGAYRGTTPNSFIRLFHASPNVSAVDIYEDGNLIVENLVYKDFTQYIPIAPGKYNINIYPTGETTNPVLNEDLYILQGTAFNVAVIGKLSNMSLYYILEPYTAQNFGRPCIRFVHLSPDAPVVDISFSDGRKVFRNVGYKDITDYICVPPGTYTFGIRSVGSNDVILAISNLQLKPNNYYTIYSTGLVEDIPSLEVVPVLEPR
jgi:hypothetical protein